VLQNGWTPLHHALRNEQVNMMRYLIEKYGANMYVQDFRQRTALSCCPNATSPIAVLLRSYMEPKPKIFALCMGLNRRLGADSPLRMLNVDVMQEIAKHLSIFLRELE
jgi:hypothetical protein